ncbi:MAG: DoxX family protein [Pseudomonadota bacterium]
MAMARSVVLSVFRVMAGLLFMQHGTTKLLGIPQTPQTGVEITSLGGMAGVIELVAGGLIVIGLFTRPAAFIASGTMAVAYFLAHANQNFYPILNGGELAALYCFAFLYLSFAGGGPIALDALFRRSRA